MDLRDSVEISEFRRKVVTWLSDNVPKHPLPEAYTNEGVVAHQLWERELYEAGYAALSWPVEYGGGGADVLTQAVFQEEYVRFDAPERLNRLGLGLFGPTVIEFGTEEQKQTWLPGILTCEELWCQGFSEPDAGSDLASLSTRADRDGDELILNGQKTWTSLAVHANWMFALVRSGRGESKHQGITYVVVPMDAVGIEIRPLRQLHGDMGFAEVFFTDVRIPITNVIGGIGNGWSVAMATLGFERGSALGNHARYSKDVKRLVEVAKELGLENDDEVVRRLADLYVETEVFRRHMQHRVSLQAQGQSAGSEASITKLFWSEMEVRIFETAMEFLGPYAELASDAPASRYPDRLERRYWHARASKIFAGTSEIQKNVIAERMLGLPRDLRP